MVVCLDCLSHYDLCVIIGIGYFCSEGVSNDWIADQACGS